MLHADIESFPRHPKPTANWEHIRLNQKQNYDVLEVKLDSSTDSSISVEHVQDDGPLADAPPPPTNPGPIPKTHKVTFGSEDIRYKPKIL